MCLCTMITNAVDAAHTHLLYIPSHICISLFFLHSAESIGIWEPQKRYCYFILHQMSIRPSSTHVPNVMVKAGGRGARESCLSRFLLDMYLSEVLLPQIFVSLRPACTQPKKGNHRISLSPTGQHDCQPYEALSTLKAWM